MSELANGSLDEMTVYPSLDDQQVIQTEYYNTQKYLKTIGALGIFHLIFLVMWIIGVTQWAVVYDYGHDNAMFILFVVSLVLYGLVWVSASIVGLVGYKYHFKKAKNCYPHWVYVLSIIMIGWPTIIGFILYVWIHKNSSETNNK